jgi:hypothetical protein
LERAAGGRGGEAGDKARGGGSAVGARVGTGIEEGPPRRVEADAAAAGGLLAGMLCPSMRISWPQRRHFMRSVLPDTFSSAI